MKTDRSQKWVGAAGFGITVVVVPPAVKISPVPESYFVKFQNRLARLRFNLQSQRKMLYLYYQEVL